MIAKSYEQILFWNLIIGEKKERYSSQNKNSIDLVDQELKNHIRSYGFRHASVKFLDDFTKDLSSDNGLHKYIIFSSSIDFPFKTIIIAYNRR